MSNSNIHLISASAGSGKTYELMEQLYSEISQKNASPSSIMAVTFTNKAANELVTRVQQKLILQGESQLSYQMGAARIGTVHSICGNLLKSYAYEMGLSPELEIIDEVQAKELFTEAFLEAPSADETERLHQLTRKFGIEYKKVNSDIEEICNKVRQNNIESKKLDEFANLSKDQLDIFLSADTVDGLYEQLKNRLLDYQASYREAPDTTKKTDKVHKAVHRMARRAYMNFFTWSDWIELANLDPAKKSEAIYAPIIECAGQLRSSSEFRKDYEELIDISFAIAKRSLLVYDELKRNLGVMDFGDQEHKTLELLSKEENLKNLEGEIDLFLVDEFQDSNPIQLAIFLKISQIAKKSIWVGDPKQSIYGFQGADPVLMVSVINSIGVPEKTKILSSNYRSTAPLVDFSSHLYSEVFQRDGIPAEKVKLEPKAEIKSECDPLAVWALNDSQAAVRQEALAIKVRQIIDSSQLVFDKSTKKQRKVTPGDIAILVRTNTGAKSISNALYTYGIRSSVIDNDILGNPEVSTCLAGFRLAINHEDTLAAAEIAIFFGHQPQDIVGKSFDESFEFKFNDQIEKLMLLDVKDRTPYELLTEVISILGIENHLRRYHDSSQKLENINSLLTFCKKYEDMTTGSQLPCTAIGFLSEIESLIESQDERDGKQSKDAVTIVTYHRSKGLEWPIVILMDLEKENWPNDQFGVRVKNFSDFDPQEPLKDRAVLYLPWLFGESMYGKRSNVDWITDLLSVNAETIQLEAQADAERRRLLYVGMTRAREQMIFVRNLRARGSITKQFFGSLKNGAGDRVIEFPTNENEPVKISGREFDCQYQEVLFSEPVSSELIDSQQSSDLNYGEISPNEYKYPIYEVHPSYSELAEEELSKWKIGDTLDIADSLALADKFDPQIVGDALHLFFASKVYRSNESAENIVKTILSNWDIEKVIDPKNLAEYTEKLNTTLDSKWPNRKELHEAHLKTFIEGTRYEGEIDLLIDCGSEMAVIDHKTGSFNADDPLESSKKYISQLDCYKKMLNELYPDKKVSTWIHWTRAGKITELKRIES